MLQRRSRQINDNVWHMLDLQRVCDAGGNVYSVTQLLEFLQKCLQPYHTYVSDKPVLELWRVNRKYLLMYKVGSQFTANVNLWQKTIHRSATVHGQQKELYVPLLESEAQMELDLMCQFLIDIIDRQKDDQGRRWSK